MKPAYFDSSVILRLVLRQKGAWEGWKLAPGACSEMARVECLRTLDRLRIEGRLDEGTLAERRFLLLRILDGLETIQVSRPILDRASETIPVALGTLDAIHLATALAWREERGEPILMATHDLALARAARAYGIETVG